MMLSDLKELVEYKIEELEAGPHPWLGRYAVKRKQTELWFRFDAGKRLRWITLSRPDGWRVMSRRFSPRLDLCNDTRSFLVSVVLPSAFSDATIYLNDQDVSSSPEMIEVSEGKHELKIDRDGFQKIVRVLDFGPMNRGNQRLRFSASDFIETPN